MGKLKKGRVPILHTVTRNITNSDNDLEALINDLPEIGIAAEEAWNNERYHRKRYGMQAIDLLLH